MIRKHHLSPVVLAGALLSSGFAQPASAMTASIGGIPVGEGLSFQTVTLWLGTGASGGGFATGSEALSAFGRVEFAGGVGAQTIWQASPTSPELTLVLDGFTAGATSTITGEVKTTAFDGGSLRIYADPARNTYSPAPASFTPAAFADGALWLDLRARPSNMPGASSSTLFAINYGSAAKSPSFISASASFDVVGGAAAAPFDTNQFDGADLMFNLAVSLQPGTPGLDYRGSAQITASTVVPVPPSVLLLGSALASAFALRRQGDAGDRGTRRETRRRENLGFQGSRISAAAPTSKWTLFLTATRWPCR